jgi:transmembrane sensor
MAEEGAERTDERRADEATAWIMRQERGLTAEEQDRFSQWLAEDPRHGAQLARFKRHWQRLETLAEWRPEHSARPNPDLLKPAPRNRWRVPAALATLAAAAAVAWVALTPDRVPRIPEPRPAVAAVVPAAPAEAVVRRELSDGSVVELNRGAVLEERFTAPERRVLLAAGEAHFSVKKDAARPFVVAAGGVAVRAVGTAFNVRLEAGAVEVLVTEGKVEVAEPGRGAESKRVPTEAAPPVPVPVLSAGERAVVSLTPQPEPVRIAVLTPGEIERVLAWQHRLLEFNAAALSEVVAEFNRRNRVQLVLADERLGAERITVSFRTDNVEGFVRLLEAGFGVVATRSGEGEIALRKPR